MSVAASSFIFFLLRFLPHGRSAANPPLKVLGILRPLHGDVRGGVNLAQVVVRKLDAGRAEVLFQPVW